MHAGVTHMPMDPAGMSADASQSYVYGESECQYSKVFHDDDQ